MLEGRKAILDRSMAGYPAGEEVKIAGISAKRLIIESSDGYLFLCGLEDVELKPETEKPEWNWKIFDAAEMPNKDMRVLVLFGDGTIDRDEWIDGDLRHHYEEGIMFYMPCSEIPVPKNIK